VDLKDLHMTTSSIPLRVATARVTPLSLKLERTATGGKRAVLRVRQLSNGKIATVTAMGQDMVDRLMALGKTGTWLIKVETTIPSDLRLLSAKVLSQDETA
jgi:hypothetical protein